MFLRNTWYVAAWAADVVPGFPTARTILSEPIALYRTSAGQIAALEDRCSHRAVPLTAGGECVGDTLRCPYHGIEFGPDGECRRIPNQEHIGEAMHIRSYAVVERDALIWIWMGDPTTAPMDAVPEHPWNTDPGWSAVTLEQITVDANWQLLTDNLLDLTHLGYVHKRTIGGDDGDSHAFAETKNTRDGDCVKMRRFIPNINPPPFYVPMADWRGRIDRWQEIDFFANRLHFYVGGVDVGTGAADGLRTGGVQFHHLHAITPISETQTCYTFSLARNFRVDDAELHAKMKAILRATLAEDIVILEAQQRSIDREPARALGHIRSDASGVLARRLIDDLARREAPVNEANVAVAHVLR